MSSKHEFYMMLALQESRKALPDCLPNPPVGCVLVRNNEIVGSGYTLKPGEGHAEALAIKSCTGQLDTVDAYITLEPCSFDGRTPSCAQLLTRCGIQKVYIAIKDTDPRNNGAGIRILVEAGVEVIEGVLNEEVFKFMSPYLIKSSSSLSEVTA